MMTRHPLSVPLGGVGRGLPPGPFPQKFAGGCWFCVLCLLMRADAKSRTRRFPRSVQVGFDSLHPACWCGLRRRDTTGVLAGETSWALPMRCAAERPLGKVEQGLPTSPSPPKWAGVFFLVMLLSWTSSRPELEQYDTVIGLRVWSKPCIMLCRMLHCLRTSHNRCFEQTSGPALCWKDHVVSYGRLKAQTSAPASPCPYRVLPCQLVPVIVHSNVCVKLESHWKASLCMLHCT